MKEALTYKRLLQQTQQYRGTGGISAENLSIGFRPAFLDTQTGEIYPCCYADGEPASMHLLDCIPSELILAYTPSGRVSLVKDSLVAGFLFKDRFYTREEASKQVMEMRDNSITYE